MTRREGYSTILNCGEGKGIGWVELIEEGGGFSSNLLK